MNKTSIDMDRSSPVSDAVKSLFIDKCTFDEIDGSDGINVNLLITQQRSGKYDGKIFLNSVTKNVVSGLCWKVQFKNG